MVLKERDPEEDLVEDLVEASPGQLESKRVLAEAHGGDHEEDRHQGVLLEGALPQRVVGP